MEDLFAKPAIVILEWAERFPLPSPWPEIAYGWTFGR
jgi:hypothetical protein